MPSSDFVDFIHRASRIPLGQSAKALVWRWRQICPLKIDIFTLSAPNSTNEVSMFKLAIEVCFENHFGLIHAISLSLGLTKSGYFFWDTRYIYIYICIYIYVLISSISMCNKNRYRNSEKTHSFKRFGQSLHQYDFPKSDGAYI